MGDDRRLEPVVEWLVACMESGSVAHGSVYIVVRNGRFDIVGSSQNNGASDWLGSFIELASHCWRHDGAVARRADVGHALRALPQMVQECTPRDGSLAGNPQADALGVGRFGEGWRAIREGRRPEGTLRVRAVADAHRCRGLKVARELNRQRTGDGRASEGVDRGERKGRRAVRIDRTLKVPVRLRGAVRVCGLPIASDGEAEECVGPVVCSARHKECLERRVGNREAHCERRGLTNTEHQDR